MRTIDGLIERRVGGEERCWFDGGKVFCVQAKAGGVAWARVRFKLRSNAKPALGRKQQIRCNEITSQPAWLIRSPATRRNLLNLSVNRFFFPRPSCSLENQIPLPRPPPSKETATGRPPKREWRKWIETDRYFFFFLFPPICTFCHTFPHR